MVSGPCPAATPEDENGSVVRVTSAHPGAVEPVGKWDAGAWGTPNCCCEHGPETLDHQAPPDGTVGVERGGGSDGAADRTLRRTGRAQGIGHRDGVSAGRPRRTPDRDQ